MSPTVLRAKWSNCSNKRNAFVEILLNKNSLSSRKPTIKRRRLLSNRERGARQWRSCRK